MSLAKEFDRNVAGVRGPFIVKSTVAAQQSGQCGIMATTEGEFDLISFLHAIIRCSKILAAAISFQSS